MKAATPYEEWSGIFLFCKKATAQLNNVGVSLLHRGRLRQAIETFTDALTVAKQNSMMGNERLVPATLFTRHDSVDIRKLLEKAYDLLSFSETSTLSDMELEVILDNENPAGIQCRCLVEEETESSLNVRKENFAIQVDHLDINLPIQDIDMAIQCSIICYNYGVTYLCLSTLPASRPFVNQLQMGALNMFQLSFSTLTSLPLVKEELQSNQMNRVLITGLLVLHNFILLSTTLGMTEERTEYLQCLGHLKQSIDEFCDFHCTNPTTPTAIAA